jgi:hypothetical protein
MNPIPILTYHNFDSRQQCKFSSSVTGHFLLVGILLAGANQKILKHAYLIKDWHKRGFREIAAQSWKIRQVIIVRRIFPEENFSV